MMQKLVAILAQLIFVTISCFGQKSNYGYGSVQIPFIDYVGSFTDGEDPTAGVILDIGYGVKVKGGLFIEAGIEYLFLNQYEKNYFSNNRDLVLTGSFNATNSSFSFVAKSVFKAPIDVDSQVFLRGGLGLNYRKLHSTTSYSVYEVKGSPTDEGRIRSVAKGSISTPFTLGFTPLVGTEFKLNDSFAVVFDLSWVRVNWAKLSDDIKFSNRPGYIPPDYKTSELFLAAKILFK